MPEEIWLPIPGYELDYYVSNMGRVSSIKKTPHLILAPRISKEGYYSVYLRLPGSAKGHFIHRLVLLAFVGPSPLPVNHKDFIRSNNCLDNLEYCTPAENNAHSAKAGHYSVRKPSIQGARHPLSKLSSEQVLEIRALKGKLSQPKLAIKFGISVWTVRGIHQGKLWKYL